MKLELKTVAIRDDGAFGVLLADGRPFVVTCERTFDGNRTVIENGTYPCVRSYFNRGGYDTFEIHVPGHSRVLFHRGNTETDSEGCVLIAESFGQLNSRTAVLDSRGGFAEFWALVGALPAFDLVVTGR